MNPLTYKEWVDLYVKMVSWEMEFDQHPGLGLQQMLSDQRRECNAEFSKFIEQKYPVWLHQKDDRPPLSVDVVDKFVIPQLKEGTSVFFFVIDCMRLDQWLVMEQYLQ